MSYHHLRLPIAQATVALLPAVEFKRNGTSFTKNAADWIEHYVIIGNRWNSGELPWLFCIEVSIELAGIPPKAGAKGLWKHCHAVGSKSALCKSLPRDFEVRPDSVSIAGAKVAEALAILSHAVADQVQQIRVRALQGLLSPLPVPPNWTPLNAD